MYELEYTISTEEGTLSISSDQAGIYVTVKRIEVGQSQEATVEVTPDQLKALHTVITTVLNELETDQAPQGATAQEGPPAEGRCCCSS